MSAKPNYLDNAAKARLERALRAGVPHDMLAERFGVNASVISKYSKQFGIAQVRGPYKT
jgi:hypothetical protein